MKNIENIKYVEMFRGSHLTLSTESSRLRAGSLCERTRKHPIKAISYCSKKESKQGLLITEKLEFRVICEKGSGSPFLSAAKADTS